MKIYKWNTQWNALVCEYKLCKYIFIYLYKLGASYKENIIQIKIISLMYRIHVREMMFRRSHFKIVFNYSI